MNRWGIFTWLGLCLSLHAGGVVEDCSEASLRAALQGGGNITFACNGTIRLAQPLVIGVDVVLDGSGHEVVLSGQQTVRVLEVQAGVTCRLVGLTLAHGHAVEGGAIWSQAATVQLERCVFIGNTAEGRPGAADRPAEDARGGAVAAVDTALQLAACLFTNNTCSGGAGLPGPTQGLPGGAAMGGAIFQSGGSLQVTGSLFGGNRATGGRGGAGVQGGVGGEALGGSLYVDSDAAEVTATEFATSKALGGLGGVGTAAAGAGGAGMGGGVHAAGGVLHLTASTVGYCEAAGSPSNPSCGGGIANLGALLAVNTTVATNLASLSGAGYSFGGGVYTRGYMSAEFCTFVASQASGAGDYNGGNLHNAGGYLALRASAIAYCLVQLDVYGPLVDQGYNICWDWSSGFTNKTSRTRLDPNLGPLADNGGPVRTTVPLPGSPLLDSVRTGQIPPADARGTARPAGSFADAGAVEGSVSHPMFRAEFLPPQVRVLMPSILRVTVSNPNDFPLHDVGFGSSLPFGFSVGPEPRPAAGCGGAVLAVASSNQVSALFPLIGAKGSCSMEVPVVSASPRQGMFEFAYGVSANAGRINRPAGTATISSLATPWASTLPAGRLPEGAFQLSGLASPLGRPGRAYFEWGAGESFSQRTAALALDGRSENVPVTAVVNGLSPATPFQFRLVVEDDAARFAGEAETFATPVRGAGTALSFDGSDDAVLIARGFGTVSNAFTMEFWARPDGVAGLPAETTAGVYSGAAVPFAIYPSEGYTRYGMGHAGVGVSIGKNAVSVFEHGFNLLAPVLVCATNLEGWNHFAVTYGAGGPPKLWINGELSRSGLKSTNIAHPSLEMSSTWTTAGRGYGFFLGQMDEVRVWSRVLTAEELTSVASRALSGAEPGLEACLQLDEGAGTVLSDRTGHGYDGVAQNGVAWIPSGAAVASPRVESLVASEVGAATATLRCRVSANGQPCRVYFQWGMGDVLDQRTAPQDLPAEGSTQLVLASLSGLRAGLSYAFRPVVEFAGTARSGAVTPFTPESAALGGLGVMFDGVGSSVRQGARFPAVTDSFTMECWAYPAVGRTAIAENLGSIVDLNGQRCVFYPQYGAPAYGVGQAVAGISVGTNGVSVIEHSDYFRPGVLSWDGPVAGWTHIAVVFRDRVPSLYINGELVRTGLRSPRPVHPSADLGMSSAQLGGEAGAYWGKLDEVRVWSVARSAEDIRAMMKRRLQGSESGLVLYYTFDAGPGRAVVNGSGSAIPGEVVGDLRWNVSSVPLDGPEIMTWSVQAAGRRGAQLRGSVNPRGHPSWARFEWGPTPSMDRSTPERDLGSGSNPVELMETLAELAAGSTNYVRLVVGTADRLALSPVRSCVIGATGAGTALDLDGENAMVTAPASFASVASNFTMEFWAKPAATTDLQTAASGSPSWLPGQRCAIFPSQGTAAYGNGHVGAGVTVGLNGINVVEHAAQSTYFQVKHPGDLGRWVHVAVVYEQDRPSLYVDGELVGAGNASPSIVHPGCNIGADGQTAETGLYAGQLDELRVWNYARSRDEIARDMHRNLSGSESGLVRYWRFDEGAGQGALDATSIPGQGGSVQGATWTVSDAPLGRVWWSPEKLTEAADGATGLEFVLQGNGIGGVFQLETGLEDRLGTFSALLPVGAEEHDRVVTLPLVVGESGYAYFRTWLWTDGVPLAGPINRVVRAQPGRGAALEFDGKQGMVAMLEQPFATLGPDFTLEFWCLPEVNRLPRQFEPCVVYPSQGAAIYGEGWFTAGVSVGRNGVAVLQHGDNYFTTVLELNQTLTGWTHVAVSWTATVPRLYVNGFLAEVGNPGSAKVRPGSQLGGGASVASISTLFQGLVDEVRVWDRALTEVEIQERMHRAFSNPVPGLAWNMRLEEGFGWLAADSVDGHRQGHLSEGVRWVVSEAPVSVLEPWLRRADGSLRLRFATAPFRPFTLLESSDFGEWLPVQTSYASSVGIVEWWVANPQRQAQRFYRVVPVP